MSDIDLEKARREVARWRILRALDAGRPLPMAEALVLQVLHDSAMQITPHELRRQLDYLEDRKLVTITGKQQPMWQIELTHLGVDIAEYTVECFPGIARPQKWY